MKPARVTALLTLVLLVVACASSSPQVKQYQAIATCNASAQAAAKAFGVLYQSKKAENPALWGDRYDKAEASYKAYQSIALVAVEQAEKGADPTLILAVVNEALNQFLSLLATFGVK